MNPTFPWISSLAALPNEANSTLIILSISQAVANAQVRSVQTISEVLASQVAGKQVSAVPPCHLLGSWEFNIIQFGLRLVKHTLGVNAG